MKNHFVTLEEIEALVTGFLQQTLPVKEWTHEAHLTTALFLLRKYTFEEATCMLRSGIITYNKSTGGENTPTKGYHETLTIFWIKIISDYLRQNKEGNLLLLCNSFLKSEYASRDYALKFYTRELLFSTKARAFWSEPDKEKSDCLTK